MDYFAITVLILAITSATTCSILENSLHYLTEHLVASRTESSSFDPFNFERKIVVDEPLLRLILLLNGNLAGFTNYYIETAEVTPDLKITLNIKLDDTTLSGSYDLNGTYYKIVPLQGKGDFSLQLTEFNLYISTQIKPSQGTLQLLAFDWDFKYKDVQVSIEGITRESDVATVLQHFIQDLVPTALDKKGTYIKSLIKNYTLTKGNQILKTMTLARYVELFKEIFIY